MYIFGVSCYRWELHMQEFTNLIKDCKMFALPSATLDTSFFLEPN
jgi:hypothetical protein